MRRVTVTGGLRRLIGGGEPKPEALDGIAGIDHLEGQTVTVLAEAPSEGWQGTVAARMDKILHGHERFPQRPPGRWNPLRRKWR